MKQISEDEVILRWLKVEATDPSHPISRAINRFLASYDRQVIIENADLNNAQENNDRRNLFNYIRGNYSLWKPIHEQTTWYEYNTYLFNPFRRVIGPYSNLTQRFDKEASLDNIILWGRSTTGPLIILEGNHRWYSNNYSRFKMNKVIVGLSNQEYDLYERSIKLGQTCNKYDESILLQERNRIDDIHNTEGCNKCYELPKWFSCPFN